MTTTLRIDERGAVTVPEELCRALGLGPGSEVIAEQRPNGVLLRPAAEKSLLELFDEAIAALPPEEVAKWPRDGAEEHDHYIYGTPKKRGS